MRYFFSFLLISFWACTFSGNGNGTVSHANVKTDSLPEKKELNNNKYSWLKNYDEKNSIKKRINVPAGYERVKTEQGSFGNWLRFVELKEGTPAVHLYNGELKGDQSVHFAVIDMDVGNKDLQQCADAVMRMRAEYLYSRKKYDQIHFNYTSGDKVSFADWCKGKRPVVKGNKVVFSEGKACDPNYAEFRKYMDNIFNYCGTLSLSKEMKTITDLKDIEPGDVFIHGGSPGHAVLVMDVAMNEKTGDKLFLLAQSYMPAQEMHILKDPDHPELSPWYSIGDIKDRLFTPEWIFSKYELKRFSEN